jgi:RNA 3'-phosphate cyclase
MGKRIIEIDGAQGEGGGQMLRTSLALSLITGKPFHLRNVRARREKPGLAAQHLMSVKAAAKIGNASVRGATLRSTDLAFEPGKIAAGDYHFAIGTAGATGLIVHTIYMPLVLADARSTVVIEGGTHVKASPNFHFLARCWAHYMRAIGINVDLTMERSGFYPRGGGLIRGHFEPTPRILPFRGMTTPTITKARVFAGVAHLPEHVGPRMIEQATLRLYELGLEVETHQESWPGGPGCMLAVELPTAPAPTFIFSLGERGKPAEHVADEAVVQVAGFLKAQPLGVDEHSADQLLLPLALADGSSEFRVAMVSSHLLTNAAVIGEFLDRAILVDRPEGEPGVVRIP